ncbi:MAG: hypothetical protein CMN33_01105 [Saprospirales bacterium]|nr:hypothetical protein [Saprospirales bacterium]
MAFAVGISLLATTALAQTKEPEGDKLTIFTRAPCDPLPVMVETIKSYGEELLFTGNGMTFSAPTGQPIRGGLMFFTNQDKGTWSVVQLFSDGVACMIMNGRDFSPYTGPRPDAVKKLPN